MNLIKWLSKCECSLQRAKSKRHTQRINEHKIKHDNGERNDEIKWKRIK